MTKYWLKFFQMSKVSIRNGNGPRAGTTKYDAHHKVLSQTYGALADLRRELSDSKETVAGREELLRSFATCADSQRAWLLLEDYFEKLSLSRKDFPEHGLVAAVAGGAGPGAAGGGGVSVPARPAFPADGIAARTPTSTGSPRWRRPRRNSSSSRNLKTGSSRPSRRCFDSPRAFLRVVCRPQPDEDQPARHRLAVEFHLLRPRTGEKARTLREIDRARRPRGARAGAVSARRLGIHPVAGRDAPPSQRRRGHAGAVGPGAAALAGALGAHGAAGMATAGPLALEFHGEVAELTPHLENGDKELAFTHRLDGARRQDPFRWRGAVLQPPAAAGAGRAARFICCATRRRRRCWSTGPASRPCRCAS